MYTAMVTMAVDTQISHAQKEETVYFIMKDSIHTKIGSGTTMTLHVMRIALAILFVRDKVALLITSAIIHA